MKRRLRKKKHRFEFREWGRQLVIIRTRTDGFNEFLDSFIMEAIEAHDCRCGGSGKDDRLDVVVELGRDTDDSDGRLRNISAWLDGRSDVASYRIGPLFDLWHDDCPELPDATPEEPGHPAPNSRPLSFSMGRPSVNLADRGALETIMES